MAIIIIIIIIINIIMIGQAAAQIKSQKTIILFIIGLDKYKVVIIIKLFVLCELLT